MSEEQIRGILVVAEKLQRTTLRTVGSIAMAMIFTFCAIAAPIFGLVVDLSNAERWIDIVGIWIFSTVISFYIWDKFLSLNFMLWLGFFLIGVSVTRISYLLDCALGLFFHPGRGFWDGGRDGIGFAFTFVLGCSGIACLSNAFRDLFLQLISKGISIAPK